MCMCLCELPCCNLQVQINCHEHQIIMQKNVNVRWRTLKALTLVSDALGAVNRLNSSKDCLVVDDHLIHKTS